jgi:hypothetical protein
MPTLSSPASNGNVSNRTVSFSWLASSDEDVSEGTDTINYTLYLDDVNVTSALGTTMDYNVSDGSHNWSVSASDGDVSNTSLTRNFTLDATTPSISHSLSPRVIINGSNVTLNASFTDAHYGSIWANVTVPNATPYQVSIPLANSTALQFNQTNDAGNYTVTFFANDTFGNVANASTYFLSEPPILFNVSTVAYNGNALSNFNISLYYASAEVAANSTTNGTVLQDFPDYVYDVKFSVMSNLLNVTLRGVNLSDNQNKKMGFDNPSVSGYITAYAINNSYNFTDAVVAIRYSVSGAA